MAKQHIAILGSTGSVGTCTLEVVRNYPDLFQIEALAARSNIDLLERQARLFSPSLVVVYEPQQALLLQRRLPHIPVLAGLEGIEVAASLPAVHCVVAAMSGSLGIRPTVAAIGAGKRIALANKELLVSAGAWITALAKKHNSPIIPIDSEHSAIFQCLQGERLAAVHRLVLTASGGPFRTYSNEQLAAIAVEDALRHPTWCMGPKITVDCSTLMNKGLEVIEAHWLFSMPIDQIEVVVHPQSIIHSMVEFCDGSIIAQMGRPSMALPIQYALTYPGRQQGFLPPFDFSQPQEMQFFPVDKERFRCLSLAYSAQKEGKSMPAYMNAANELLVERFLKGQIRWVDIAGKLELAMSKHIPKELMSLDDIFAIDALARREVAQL